MKKNTYMKKKLTLLFLTLTIFCFSEEKQSCRQTCNYQNRSSSIRPLTYSKPIYPKKYFTELNYLLMNFFEDGIEYAEIVNDGSKKFRNEQKFNPGLRITFGFSLSKTSLAEKYLDLTWTYIKMKRGSDTNVRGTIYNLFLPPNFLNSIRASASLSGDFNTLDFNISKPYHVSKYYISKPSIGIRGALINQKYKIAYDIANTITTLRAKNDYLGVGLKAGYSADFIITSNYSFYAKTNFALLYGRIDLSQKSPGEVSAFTRYTIKEKTYRVQPNSEIAFGLSFDRSFKNTINKLSIKVGYEFLHFWDQIQLKRFMDEDPTAVKTVSRNNLKFNGLVFSLSFDI
ncbi:MAG: hypothetical protein KR126chlam4_00294 [Candidatus Anoxychlamydiales bacterium]|nr:hypothetical protein [Candidatus Anoxychlamydiales bacterium]NGX40472.1 hypothetical protein [Candidatus Anoxychlamydiales bacterium]